VVNSRALNRVRYYIIPARLNMGSLQFETSQRLELLALCGLRGFSRG